MQAAGYRNLVKFAGNDPGKGHSGAFKVRGASSGPWSLFLAEGNVVRRLLLKNLLRECSANGVDGRVCVRGLDVNSLWECVGVSAKVYR